MSRLETSRRAVEMVHESKVGREKRWSSRRSGRVEQELARTSVRRFGILSVDSDWVGIVGQAVRTHDAEYDRSQ